MRLPHARQIDEEFSRLLEAYDDALASGSSLPVATPAHFQPEEASEFQGIQDCLRQLELKWPRARRFEKGVENDSPLADSLSFLLRNAPSELGRFQIQRKLGEGGHGVVFLAFDTVLRRAVALKLPRPETLLTESARRRFLHEARACAALDHPNLIAVYDAGDAGPFCYITEAYCDGPTLSAWLKQQTSPVDCRLAAEIVQTLADAVTCAHRSGILHRDIKPANVLLEPKRHETDSETDSFDFTPKLADFGLAKHTESDLNQTETVTLAGTVPYMAPEQAAGRREAVGFPTDVYALGVMLFELLTRRKPFEGDTAADTLRRIVSEEPASLRRLRPDVPRDLEAICVRCLERAPAKRYPTASTLAEDLGRFLEGRPTHARPIGAVGHTVKWARRNRGWAAAIALFFVVGTALPAAAVWSARSQAEEERRSAILQQLQNVRLAPHRVVLKESNWLDDGLAGVREAVKIRADDALRNQAAAFLSGPTAHLNKWMAGFLASSIAFDAAGRRVLIGGSDADEARIWDSQTDEILQTSGLAGNGPVLFRPNGDAWQVVASRTDPRAIRVWNVDKRELVRELRISEKPGPHASTDLRVNQIVLTAEGHFAAASTSAEKGTALIAIWDLESGNTVRQIEQVGREVTAIALSTEGQLLASGDDKGRIALWSLPDGGEIPVASAGSSRLNCLAFGRNVREQFNPDRTARWLLAGGDAGGRVTVWDLARRAPRTYCQGTYYDVGALAFCPDSVTLASTGRINTTLWDIATGRPLVEVQCSDNMTGLAISPDGRKLACSMHHVQHPPELPHEGLQVWDLEHERGIKNLRGLESPIAHSKVQFSDDGSRIAAVSIDWRVAIWDRRKGFLQSVFDITPGVTADNTGLAFSHDGRKLAVSVGHEARLWDLQTGQSTSWRLPEGLVDTLAFDPTDAHLFLLRMETADGIHAPDSSSPFRTFPRVCRVRDLLASGEHDLSRLKKGNPLWETDFFNAGIFIAQVSHDGRYSVATGDHGQESRERFVKVFDSASGKQVLSWKSGDFLFEPTASLLQVYLGKNGSGAYCLVKCPSGELVDSLEHGWHAFSPQAKLMAFRRPDGFGYTVARRGESKRLVTLGIDLMTEGGRPTFSLDGTLLAWGNRDGTVTVCDIPEIQRRLASLGLAW